MPSDRTEPRIKSIGHELVEIVRVDGGACRGGAMGIAVGGGNRDSQPPKKHVDDNTSDRNESCEFSELKMKSIG